MYCTVSLPACAAVPVSNRIINVGDNFVFGNAVGEDLGIDLPPKGDSPIVANNLGKVRGTPPPSNQKGWIESTLVSMTPGFLKMATPGASTIDADAEVFGTPEELPLEEKTVAATVAKTPVRKSGKKKQQARLSPTLQAITNSVKPTVKKVSKKAEQAAIRAKVKSDMTSGAPKTPGKAGKKKMVPKTVAWESPPAEPKVAVGTPLGVEPRRSTRNRTPRN